MHLKVWVMFLLLAAVTAFHTAQGAVVRCGQPSKGLGVATFLGDCSGVAPNTTCGFICMKNFRTRNVTQLTCGPDGAWDNPVAVCEALTCADFSESGMSWTQFCEARTDQRCQDDPANGPRCICKEGFSKRPGTDACISSVTCPKPIKGAGVSSFLGDCTGATPNTTCHFVCLENRKAKNGKRLTCQADGTWDKPQATCEEYPTVLCPKPDHDPEVTLEGDCDGVPSGSECRFKCPGRSRPLNGGMLTCLTSGAWDASAKCQVDRCTEKKEPGLTWDQFCGRVLHRLCQFDTGSDPSCAECQEGFKDLGSAACAGPFEQEAVEYKSNAVRFLGKI